jgi:hypothetical protein
VLPAGLVAEAPGQAHRPKVAEECPGHAVDPAQQHRRGVGQPRAIVKDPIGRGEAQAVTLVIGGNGRITLTEQLGESEQIELVALQARLDEHRQRIPAWASQVARTLAHVAVTAHAAQTTWSERASSRARSGHARPPIAGPDRTRSDTQHGPLPTLLQVRRRVGLVADGSPDRTQTGATASGGLRRSAAPPTRWPADLALRCQPVTPCGGRGHAPGTTHPTWRRWSRGGMNP